MVQTSGKRAAASLSLCSDLFRVLADSNRFSILCDLIARAEPVSVSDVAEGFSIDVSVVSRHLAKLADAGVLVREKIGKEARYRVDGPALASTLRGIADAIEHAPCCASLRRGSR